VLLSAVITEFDATEDCCVIEEDLDCVLSLLVAVELVPSED
jgi:hypothetical protein